jgi:hypothetical protein
MPKQILSFGKKVDSPPFVSHLDFNRRIKFFPEKHSYGALFDKILLSGAINFREPNL